LVEREGWLIHTSVLRARPGLKPVKTGPHLVLLTVLETLKRVFKGCLISIHALRQGVRSVENGHSLDVSSIERDTVMREFYWVKF
jgi:hypothetical protein